MQKFKVTFNNGFWKVFNLHTYTDVNIFYLRKDAEEVQKKLEAKHSKNLK